MPSIDAPEFFDLTRVDAELRRVYDIRAGCRRCLPLCPSFKVLFDRLDVEAVDGDVEKLPATDVKDVVDLCYQCKRCFNHCPYTPPHRWVVDFPRLMLRARAAEAKQRRRVSLGRHLSFVFENRLTVRFRIQEMIRAERLVDDARIADEIDVYNALLPGAGELSATLMIEIGEAGEIQSVLDKLLGLDTRGYVRLEVGPHRIPAVFEAGRSDEERGKLSAVHFVRLAVPVDAEAFRRAEVALAVDHPNERARTVLSPETKTALAADLESA
ncbi:MAG: hypothetical protein DMD81_26655 [Candidatus Rokuibacteriota bacterium]|nr:MAG: hypothetical protein DMD81_26655 [Candidatus Rokubacteria bacterium]